MEVTASEKVLGPSHMAALRRCGAAEVALRKPLADGERWRFAKKVERCV